MCVGMSKNFWDLQVCFFMDWKVASKKCPRLPFSVLIIMIQHCPNTSEASKKNTARPQF